MTDAQQREAARQFYYRWKNKGNEDEHARSYWIELMTDILGIENVTKRLDFEKKVIGSDGNTKRIDVYIPETHVLIEQKSFGIALDKPQSGHNGMTPYEQAKMYDNGLPFNEKSRWIIISNFAEIWIYDMNQKKPESTVIKLTLPELPSKFHILDFIANSETEKITQEMKISLRAGEIVGELYDAFHRRYKNPDSPESLMSLNKLCVRLVFLCFAEDAGILGRKAMFHDYMEQFPTKGMRRALIELFEVLNQKPEDRDKYLTEDLAAFPYVNGGLFEDEHIEIPMFSDEIRDLLLNKASAEFDWSGISPTIFGAVFESTLNPETRRSGGMHYTSIENIHKVIDPLFLDALKDELDDILAIGVLKTKQRKLRAYQEKLASLKFMDPASGSGNFLTETYICIRRLENKVIQELESGQSVLTFADPIKVSISQFYGIEINDFAVTVAKTALWIAESQMMQETEGIVHMVLNFLPLKTNANIVEGNALKMDWNEVVDRNELSYCFGNPPFIGASMMTKAQKKEATDIFGKVKRANSVDYVGAWYHLAAKYIRDTDIRVAFVSTNSITQGEQVAPLWTKLLKEYNIHIDFAYRTFKWNSESLDKAAVHCVIIGFSSGVSSKVKYLFTNGTCEKVSNINPYLIGASDVIVSSSGKSLWNAPRMTKGNQPSDGGNLILSEEERDALIKKDPDVAICVRRYVGSRDFLNDNEKRYCLWLKGIDPSVYRKNPEIKRRLEEVRKMREKSTSAPTRALAEKPYLFFSTPQTDGNYLCIPEVSSERRRYIPMGFMDASVIASNKLLIISDAELYHFGILTSNVHMAWMRVVGGRLKSDYQYSGAMVYNTFPWPEASDEQRRDIIGTARGILDARKLYPSSSLADLYDPLTMPPELRKAHAKNDAAVMRAYGMPIKETDEEKCVGWLMEKYLEKCQS